MNSAKKIFQRTLPSFGVEDKPELVVRLGYLNNIHETGREVGVCPRLAVINFYVLLHHANHLGLLAGQGIL